MKEAIPWNFNNVKAHFLFPLQLQQPALTYEGLSLRSAEALSQIKAIADDGGDCKERQSCVKRPRWYCIRFFHAPGAPFCKTVQGITRLLDGSQGGNSRLFLVGI